MQAISNYIKLIRLMLIISLTEIHTQCLYESSPFLLVAYVFLIQDSHLILFSSRHRLPGNMNVQVFRNKHFRLPIK